MKTTVHIFRSQASPEELMSKLRKSYKNIQAKDIYKEQLEELLEINNPGNENRGSKKNKSNDIKDRGVWVYYPWNSTLVHTLDENDYYKLRTNRNRDLLTETEQLKFRDFKVGIAGLSIGSNIAISLAHLGTKKLKISDFDDLSTSNLNRVPFGLSEIGDKKAELTAQKLFEIDPFINLQIFDEGLTGKNIENFLIRKGKLDVVVDALDDFEVKILLRLSARKHQIPVLMFTNLGDGCLVDVERYDKDKNMEIFNGLLGSVPEKILKSKMTEQDKHKFAVKLVGTDNIPTKALESLLQIGKTLVDRPQLSSTVTVSSGLAGFIIKKIALDEHSPSGRYLIPLEATVFSENKTSKPYSNEQGRNKVITKIKKIENHVQT
jgi:tRNA A37 threonylcarbamoyladenosine dehydratase